MQIKRDVRRTCTRPRFRYIDGRTGEGERQHVGTSVYDNAAVNSCAILPLVVVVVVIHTRVLDFVLLYLFGHAHLPRQNGLVGENLGNRRHDG